MRFFRRFAAVGAAVTLVDIVLVVWIVRTTTWSLFAADVLAVVLATLMSYVAHRAISYPAEPARRWFRDLRHYVLAAALALVVDVALFVAVASAFDDERSMRALLAAKAFGLVGAFAVRMLSYRQVMFKSIRADQERPLDRSPSLGDVRLSLVIPAFGEEDGIGVTLAAVEAALGSLRSHGGFEVIVVDDGSPDSTADAARRAGADVVVALAQNRGKGAAVRAGVLAARGRTIAFTDADLSYAPQQILGLLREVESGWDVVVGSRKHTETRTLVAAGRLREIGGRVINALTSLVLLGQYRDTQCGLKAMRSDAARLIFERSRIDGFAFDVEVFHLVERFRLSLLEVPVELTNSSRSTVRVVRDAARLVRDLFRIRRTAHSGGYELVDSDSVVSQ